MRVPTFNPPRLRGRIAANLNAGAIMQSEFCVSGTVTDGQACINTPIGNECVSVPGFIPNGTAFKACADLCKHFGIPTGVCITVDALGKQVAHECFGKC